MGNALRCNVVWLPQGYLGLTQRPGLYETLESTVLPVKSLRALDGVGAGMMA